MDPENTYLGETVPYSMAASPRYRAQWDLVNDATRHALIAPRDFEAGEVIFLEEAAVFKRDLDHFGRPWHAALNDMDEDRFDNYILRLISKLNMKLIAFEAYAGIGTILGCDYPQDAGDCLFRPVVPTIITRERFNAVWEKLEADKKQAWDQEKEWRLVCRFFEDTVVVTDAQGVQYHALGLLTGLMNHSCQPNAVMSLENEGGMSDSVTPCAQIRMQAVKPIRAGDEITRSYIGGFRGTVQEQLDQIRSQYGFVCRCRGCLDAEYDPNIRDLRNVVYELYTEFSDKEKNMDLSMSQCFRHAGLVLDGFDALGVAHEPVLDVYQVLHLKSLAISDAIRGHYFISKAIEWYGDNTNHPDASRLLSRREQIWNKDTKEYEFSIMGFSQVEEFDMNQPLLEELMFIMNHDSKDADYYCVEIVDGIVQELPAHINKAVQARAEQALLRIAESVRQNSEAGLALAREKAQEKSVEELAREIEGIGSPEDLPKKNKKSKSKKKKKSKTATSTEQGSSSTTHNQSTADQDDEKAMKNAVESPSVKEATESADEDVVTTEKESVSATPKSPATCQQESEVVDTSNPKSPATRQQASDLVNTSKSESLTSTAVTTDSANMKDDSHITDDKTASDIHALRPFSSPERLNAPKLESPSDTALTDNIANMKDNSQIADDKTTSDTPDVRASNSSERINDTKLDSRTDTAVTNTTANMKENAQSTDVKTISNMQGLRASDSAERMKDRKLESRSDTAVTNITANMKENHGSTDVKTASNMPDLLASTSPEKLHAPKPTFKTMPVGSTIIGSPINAATSTEDNNSMIAPSTVTPPAFTQALTETPAIPQPLVEPTSLRSLTSTSSTPGHSRVGQPTMANPLYNQEGSSSNTAVSRRQQRRRRPAPVPVRPRGRGTQTERVRIWTEEDDREHLALVRRVEELEDRNAFLESVAGLVAEEDAVAVAAEWVCPFGAADCTSKQAWLASDGSKEDLRLNPRDVGHLLAAKDGTGARLEGFVLRARRDSACGRLQGDKEFVGGGRLRAHSFGNDASKVDALKQAEVSESKEW